MADHQQTITALREAVDTAASGHRLDADTAQRAWSAGRGARRPVRAWLAVAATVVGVGGGATALATWHAHDRTPARPGVPSCTGAVSDAALPGWATAGFGPGAAPPHVTGARGEILGVLFVQPLRVHQPAGRHNKILWVAKNPGHGPLTINATLADTGVTAVRTVADGPGPSYLDLPRAGCWTLVLRWSGQRDTVAVPYSS